MGAFIDSLKHAFAVEPELPAKTTGLPAALERIAGAIVDRGLETPAIILLQAVVPLSFLGSQAMFACWPLVKLASIEADYREVAAALEDRRTLGRLASRIEELSTAGAP